VIKLKTIPLITLSANCQLLIASCYLVSVHQR
jgi:hypothetical protein